EARLRTVIADTPVVLFTLDHAGICTLSEGRGLARLGLKPGEVVGLHFSETLAAFVSDPERAEGYFTRALAGEPVTWIGSAGEMTFECRLTPVHDVDGRVSGVIGVAIDVTERERSENALLALERKLLEAKRLESLGVLAGGVAHDFNNLLVNVLGNASLAASELPEDSPAHQSLRRIEAAARRGSELTRQMLSYAGKEPMSFQPVDVSAAVVETLDLLQVSIPPRVAATITQTSDPLFSTKFAGRGLGLATVLGVVRAHHGGLAVASEPGRGTTFRVFLPCAERPARTAAAEPGSPTVLIVDDEEDV